MAAGALLTDLYQLTMLKAYWEHGMRETAVFEFFVRRLPPNRNFLLAAGLAHALDYLEGLRFEPDELEWIGGQPGFPSAFVDWLADLRFNGDVDAMPEGTVFFPEEPLLRVTAPLPEAQLVETRLISLLNYASLIASRAVRFRLAAPKARLVDFGLRRAHGSEAGLLAARAAYIAGFDGTATALAGKRWGIPTFGTMAHSFIQAHDSEADAFIRFARAHPDNTVLLIDTYDTGAGASKVVEIAPGLRAEGIEIQAVRLDSGDLAAHARRVRRILDEGGCPEVRIFASSSLDEHDVARLAHAPIDGFGVGAALTVSADEPTLDSVYKLQEYAGRPRRKRSEGKATWPGRKQVFRTREGGRLARDVLGLEDEALSGEALLGPVARAGARIRPAPPLEEVRERVRASLKTLPPELRGLDSARTPFPVEPSPAVRELAREVDRRSAG
ncbi:MAG: nicotinate phosphoribosyltransferase [Gemmatimonadota bacterium]|uniref:nicotinate phosphoribosyltransferase n=1 Tax=Candidatus Palauibacter scopulicola TaxID=3056741 RepID=UPI0023A3F753|nr:nicotinate phosphoribosyltransferase [Candidatus Palauibacter scopulicola]MDE2662090.1 nicotinate phosphoribosyltransferase [Candidatus Palauibacter scopulicola]